MLSVWLEKGELGLREIERPSPPTGEALVRVLRAGICNTDLELVRGYYPYRGVLGHEFAGEIVESRSGRNGERVVGEINAVCNECTECANGRPSHCRNRTVLGIVDRDGAFAEYLVLPEANLHSLPERLTLEQATFVEPLAAAFQIEQQIEIAGDDRILIVGDGKLGQLIARAMLQRRHRVWVAGRHRSKLDRLDRLGAEVVHSPEQLPPLLSGRFDVAVDCAGNSSGFESALLALRPRGTLVMKSTYAGELTFDASKVVVDEIRLLGSRCGPFAPAIAALRSGQVVVDDLVDSVYPLSDAMAAFDRARQPSALKVLLRMDG